MSVEKYLQSKGFSKSTVKFYHSQILNFITWCDMQNMEPEQITTTDVAAYMKHLQNKGQQSYTRGVHLNIIKHFFNYQIKNEQREDNPAKQLKIRGTKSRTLYPLLSKQKLEQIYAGYEIPAADDARANRNWFTIYRLSKQRNKAILSLMIYQGLCTDEINRITLKDIKLKEGTIYIAGTRTSNERTLELKPHQVMELMEYGLQIRTALEKLQKLQSDQYFLPTPTAAGKIVCESSKYIWKRLTGDIKAQCSQFINFQQVRSSVIIHWLKQHHLRQVQYMAGHRYISSTESYLAGQTEDLQSDIDKFHPLG